MQEKQPLDQRTTSSAQLQNEKVAFLAHSDLFGYLPPADLSTLERLTTIITCPPGRILYRPGEKGTVLFLLISGNIQLYHISPDGRKLITASLRAGASFGELPLFGQALHTSFAEAIENSQLCTLNRQDIDHLLAQKPEIALGFLKVITHYTVQLEAQLIDTTFKSTLARLATLLLQLAQKQGATLVVEGVSHEELAERLGVYRETVSAALRELKDAGTITSGRKHITIRQPTRLKEIAAC